ncbi:uncharacterized protein LOC122501529 [Leptopilina heterotoma]|uniref:uncharacterized protein LOC122501529 n=1 Tax=Leptopilina heterotoma TaxID=63436 RepID=UPI001CA9ABCC|nr:uncharacterized protein LOC122501529 [Leptopilina heterotoma]
MPYTPPGSRRARERGGRQFEELGRERARMERRGRPQSRHQPFPEFDTGDVVRERPSYLSFPIIERVTEEPLRAQTTSPEEEPKARGNGEEEGAVGGKFEPVTDPNDWAELSGLENLVKPRAVKGGRPDGAEVVVPYRWPADRKVGESMEEYESRLAEFELERFVQNLEPLTSVALEEIRAKQRRERERRKQHVIRKEDMESQEPAKRAQRSHSPHPGPPVRRVGGTGARPKEYPGTSERRSDPEEKHAWRTRKTGVIFGGLKEIPTSEELDPPPYSCFNCWQRGHRAVDCPKPVTCKFCSNCGRRHTAVKNCPRCAEAYLRHAGIVWYRENDMEDHVPVLETREAEVRNETYSEISSESDYHDGAEGEIEAEEPTNEMEIPEPEPIVDQVVSGA